MKSFPARWLLVFGIAACMHMPASAFPWGKLAARDNRATVRITAEWAVNNDFKAGYGTGFALTKEGHVLTVAHVIPPNTVKKFLLTGETEAGADYPAQKFQMRVLQLDREADFAILVPEGSQPVLTPVPIGSNWKPEEAAPIYVRGFPRGGDLLGKGGFVTRTVIAYDVPTDILLQVGFSGAPVYQSGGELAGMARGGVPVANIKDPYIHGLGFFVPYSLISPLFVESVKSALIAPPVQVVQGGERQIIIMNGGIFGGDSITITVPNASVEKSPVITPPPTALPTIRVSYPVRAEKLSPTPILRQLKALQDKDLLQALKLAAASASVVTAELAVPAETQTFNSGKITAEPGYRIDSYTYQEHSAASMTEPKFVIAPDGDSMEMTYSLTSGPGTNQTRGWLEATITTKQIRR